MKLKYFGKNYWFSNQIRLDKPLSFLQKQIGGGCYIQPLHIQNVKFYDDKVIFDYLKEWTVKPDNYWKDVELTGKDFKIFKEFWQTFGLRVQWEAQSMLSEKEIKNNFKEDITKSPVAKLFLYGTFITDNKSSDIIHPYYYFEPEIDKNELVVFFESHPEQKYVFNFKNNTFKLYENVNNYEVKTPKWVFVGTFYNTFDKYKESPFSLDKEYKSLNKRKPGDKKFFVSYVIDGYVDPETQAWMDEREQEPDFDPWDDEFDFCDYQKRDIYILWAKDKKSAQALDGKITSPFGDGWFHILAAEDDLKANKQEALRGK